MGEEEPGTLAPLGQSVQPRTHLAAATSPRLCLPGPPGFHQVNGLELAQIAQLRYLLSPCPAGPADDRMLPEDPKDDSTSLEEAEQIFEQHLSHLEEGREVDVEKLCQQYPEHRLAFLSLQGAVRMIGAARQQETVSMSGLIRARYGDDADPGVILDAEEDRGALQRGSDVFPQQDANSPLLGRYRIKHEVARGGQGVVLRVWDEDLRRHLAMKVMLPTSAIIGRKGSAKLDSKNLSRFLEEAQVTGQLDHPGFVPVHEIGVSPDGRVFFTMKLVRGQSLKSVFQLVHEDHPEWNLTRVVGIILRVCEAMAYAHEKSVVHRDLKPGNVMVGKHGAVYVMDWGLARVLGRKETKDIRLRQETEVSHVVSQRNDDSDGDPESPLVTMDGDVVGTPAYMCPEQARGEVELVDRRADVYSVGAILYHLLAGSPPYVPAGARISNRTILHNVLQGAPLSLAQAAPSAPAELVAITEKAMARNRMQRYADMGELAADVRAFLENRVVKAFEQGPIAELKKLLLRNKLTASIVIVSTLAILGATTGSSVVLAGKNKDLEEARDEARFQTQEILSLSALQELETLVQRADRLWPVVPERIADYQSWLKDADELTSELDRYQASLQSIRQLALPATFIDINIDSDPTAVSARAAKDELQAREADLIALRTKAQAGDPQAADGLVTLVSAVNKARQHLETRLQIASQVREWRFSELDDQWRHDRLEFLVASLETLLDPEIGMIHGLSAKHGIGIARRLELASSLEERTLLAPESQASWAEACASIADPADCPAYGGLSIQPQLGLLPLGRDRSSGLWEFADIRTGVLPSRNSQGELTMSPENAIVLVLLPGGEFEMGAVPEDPDAPRSAGTPQRDEAPIRKVRLSPFFFSKYELTQAQWERAAGTNPSSFAAGSALPAGAQGATILGSHPVESISWLDCQLTLSWLGMRLPTEAQWEYGVRGGTSTVWSTGDRMDTLTEAANIQDPVGAGAGQTWQEQPEPEISPDGHAIHAPVGSFAANDFGLHDMHGNVWEWCRDAYGKNYDPRNTIGDHEAYGAVGGDRSIRGGAYYFPSYYARSARRYHNLPGFKVAFLGVRPMRELE